MADKHLIPATVREAFRIFASDTSLLALPLLLSEGEVQALPAISYPNDPSATFQDALTRLEDVVKPRTPAYILLRRDDLLSAITYVPYLAKAESRQLYLDNRHKLVHSLGEEHFAASFISKEVAEITDARSWDERDGHGESWNAASEKTEECEACDTGEAHTHLVKDAGYKQNKCRLCDRRMKNKIEQSALDALRNMHDAGDCVQISVNIPTETLQLNFSEKGVSPAGVATKLPAEHPSFTFYRNPDTQLLYFIFCSPDCAPVRERMGHTLAIPPLINIIAKDNGVNVDQKIEIHDGDNLDFARKDERIGKYRSLYMRNEFVGTESTWEKMDEYQKVLDSV
ncbi:hypothetical protein BDV95DRAFT_603909 [Massariosphaeria phaeospora]|uniref:ADF-H domain-containing protein n=1 Tax=Massariosphaeria phaeospora TaxID=100035 RepID=A0A7C8MJW5_9PLEO|nr:hypothetical protein BDV95DRAFT_603909 [Massariosphaeria phaeospora]